MVTMFLVPILTYYMLRDWSEVIASIRSLIPIRYMGIVDEIFGGISENISKYLHGQAKVCLILMVLYSSILVANRLHFGLMIGMSIGAFAFVPFVGFITGLAVAAYVAFQQFGDTAHVMMVVISMLVGQFIDSNFVTPKIIGSSLDLSPSWMIFGLMSSFLVFGVVGALFALPIVVVGTVLVRAAIKFYRSTSYYVHAK